MRQIKFRAWDVNKMLYNVAVKDSFAFYNGEHLTTVTGNCAYNIMQFTGLFDKNGKEIYEGDIIKATYYNFTGKNCELIQEVCFDYGCFIAKTPDCKNAQPELDRNNSPLFWLKAPSYCEVIGNIHQNPELLKS